jgi:hypothetical protein
MKKDNPEKMVNKGTQDTGQINVIEYRKGNEKEQSREISIIGYKGHRTINVREYPRGNKIGQFRETGTLFYQFL